MKIENIKLVEIRDRATLIPAIAIRIRASDEKELFLLKQDGYRSFDSIILTSIQNPHFSENHSSNWQNVGRTFHIAHKYIEDHFDEIENCQVIDVEFICGETENPCDPAWKEIANELLKEFSGAENDE